MLISLQIKNYALIRLLEIQPDRGMNIITGETGAGKSIMIGAVGLLLGNRADTKVLYDENRKCLIEGIFDISEYNLKELFITHDLDYLSETIIRREIAPSGKSRAFINDTPVTLDIMKELGTHLMDLHSQHDTYKLSSLNYQLSVVDVFAHNQDLLKNYHEAYYNYRNLRKQLEQLEDEADSIRKEADYNHFLFDELEKANLREGEQEELEEEINTLEHAEEIKSGIMETISLLNEQEISILGNLSYINKKLESLAVISHSLKNFSERINSSYLELKDISRELESEAEKIEYDPGRLEEVQNRINMIYKLEQKHQVSDISGLTEIKGDLQQKVNRSLNLDEEIGRMQDNTAHSHKRVMKIGQEISSNRKKSFEKIINHLEGMLRNLGIPDARLKIEHAITEPGENGIDGILLKFSANKGVEPQELKQVASGGEFSRLMFCIKHLIASKTALPTLILDEIDMGISGETALKMAGMMRQMAANHQLMVITHLPQIASAGNAHYFVYKDSTAKKSVSQIRVLEGNERVVEIAKMIGGDHPSTAAYENAKELLDKSYIN